MIEPAEELTEHEKNIEVSGAHYTAQELTNSLHLVYWFFDRDQFAYNYHKKLVVEKYNKLTESLKKAGLIDGS